MVASISGYSTDRVADQTTGIFGKAFNWMSGKNKNRQSQINTGNQSNILKASASSLDIKKQLAAKNSANNTVSRNINQLYNLNSTSVLSVKKGGTVNPAKLRNIANKAKYKSGVKKFENGGQLVNVIPSGALHAHKNNYDGELKDAVTHKGIPVISKEGGEITQHAEIERNEIIFNKDLTDKILDFHKE